MKSKMGIWIDHKRAVLVSIGNKGETIKEIRSDIKNNVRRSGGGHSRYFMGEISPEDNIERRFQSHLDTYYDEVILSVKNAESLYIFGPGEAKHELKKRFSKKDKNIHITGIETADKMTDRQIAAKIRKVYQSPQLNK